MSRPKKENLDYFPFDVDFFSDKKIKILKAKFGADGIAVYLYILCEIYHNGYFAEYDEDFVLMLSDFFNFSESKTRQILAYLLNRSLLVSILVESVTVITARSVQRRYQEAKKWAKRDIFVNERIWLLQKEETEPFIKMHPVDSFSQKNKDISEKNDNKSEKNRAKESKVKESKVKESMCVLELPCKNGSFAVDKAYLDTLTHTHPNMDVEKSLQHLRTYLQANPEKQRYTSAVRGYIEQWVQGDDESGKYRKSAKSYPATYDISLYESTSVIYDEE